MLHDTSESFNFGEMVERYRIIIGTALLIIVLVGTGVLIYQGKEQKAEAGDQVAGLESRIADLEVVATAPKNNSVATETTSLIAVQNVPASEPPPAPAVSSKTVAPTAPISGKVNINTASLAALDSLSGIGPTYAQRIIDYRESHGGFKTIDEIKEVKGIGDKTFEKFKDRITVE